MTLREQIEQILKSEKREFWVDGTQYFNPQFFDGSKLEKPVAHGCFNQNPKLFNLNQDNSWSHVIDASYVSKLESLVRLLPGAVEALELCDLLLRDDKLCDPEVLTEDELEAWQAAKAALADFDKKWNKGE